MLEWRRAGVLLSSASASREGLEAGDACATVVPVGSHGLPPERMKGRAKPVSVSPEQGSLVEVGPRCFLAVEIQQSILTIAVLRQRGSHPQHLMVLASADEEPLGEERQMIWELEPGARVVVRGDVPRTDGFDAPRRLGAFWGAVVRGAASPSDVRALLPPIPSGMEIEGHQLDPMVGTGASSRRKRRLT